MAVIVGCPGLETEQAGLQQLRFWARPLSLPSCLSPSSVPALFLETELVTHSVSKLLMQFFCLP